MHGTFQRALPCVKKCFTLDAEGGMCPVFEASRFVKSFDSCEGVVAFWLESNSLWNNNGYFTIAIEHSIGMWSTFLYSISSNFCPLLVMASFYNHGEKFTGVESMKLDPITIECFVTFAQYSLVFQCELLPPIVKLPGSKLLNDFAILLVS